MQNVLNCVYYQGNQYEIEGMTNINTWRYILNEIFGTDYELLEPKQWNEVEQEYAKKGQYLQNYIRLCNDGNVVYSGRMCTEDEGHPGEAGG